MAYIEKHPKGWRAHVQRNGQRKSALWPTKREAEAWARMTEEKFSTGEATAPVCTFGELVRAYLRDVSAHKRGAVWESRRIGVMLEHFKDETLLTDIDAPQIAKWRDTRLRTVSPSTVVREKNLLHHMFTVARNEWRWIKHDPFQGVKMPEENQARHQVWPWQLVKRVLRAPRSGKTREVQAAFHIALRTGMRLSEVLQAPECFDAKRRVVVLAQTKTTRRVEIPIGRIAAKLLARPAFVVGPNEASTLFAKLCRELLIEGLTFHDARATALTHLARKVDVMVLAKISRHRDLKILLNTYYRVTPEQIAARI